MTYTYVIVVLVVRTMPGYCWAQLRAPNQVLVEPRGTRQVDYGKNCSPNQVLTTLRTLCLTLGLTLLTLAAAKPPETCTRRAPSRGSYYYQLLNHSPVQRAVTWLDFSAPHSKTITQNPNPNPSPESRRCPELDHNPNPSPNPNPNEQWKKIKERVVGLQPTVIASRAPHLLLEQSVMIRRIEDSKNRGRASPVKERADNCQTLKMGRNARQADNRLNNCTPSAPSCVLRF